MMQTSFALLRRARPLWRRPSLPTFAAPLSTLQRADSTFWLSEDDEEENAQFARGHAQWLRLSTTFDAEQVAALSQMLAATGARSRADVGEFVHERDLIAAGASLVDSRRLLMGAAIPPSQTSTMMRPQAALKEAAEAGLARGQRGSGVIFTSSVLGGMMLSFGGAMYVVMGGGNPLMAEMLPGMHKIASAAVFPVGLSMVVFTGTDLLTSNMMYHTLPFLTHQHRNVSLATASRVWSISFAGNLVGSIAIGELYFLYRYISRESWSQFDSLPLTSLTCFRRRQLPPRAATSSRATLTSRGLRTSRMRRCRWRCRRPSFAPSAPTGS